MADPGQIEQAVINIKTQKTMMKHRIYTDEVGNPDLDSSDNPNHCGMQCKNLLRYEALPFRRT
jgi:hypothetical protein